MFRFRTSALPWLPKIWSSASAMSLLPKIWSSTSALSFCIDCQKFEVPLPHFRSALTAKYMKFCFRTSALHWLVKIWSSAFRTCSARTSKDVKLRFRISSLPGLPKICSFASALSLNLDLTAKDLKIGFSTNTLPSLPNIGRSAPALPFCIDCKRSVVSDLPSFPKIWTHFCSALTAKGLPPQFRCRFILCISTQFRAVLHEGLALQRDEASLLASKNQIHLIHTKSSLKDFYMYPSVNSGQLIFK